MPPPPPPSKSYLLVFDSDSSDDSEDEYRREDYYRTYENIQSVPPSQDFNVAEKNGDDKDKVKNTTTESGAKKGGDVIPIGPPSPSPSPSSSPHEEEEDHQSSITTNDQSHQNQKLTKNQKKRLQRKQRRKKKAEQGNEEDKNQDDQHDITFDTTSNSVVITEKSSSHVTFSDVSIRAFPRAFSGDAVPGHGGWPLGMKLDDYKDYEQIPLDEYETSKQKQLRERWMAILSSRDKATTKLPSPSSKNKKEKENVIDDKIVLLMGGSASDTCNKDDGDDTSSENVLYESRQWDYRSRVKNPLFGLVSENERHAMFLEASDTNPATEIEGQNHNNSNNKNNNNRRIRSNSMGNHDVNTTRRSRSNSVGNHDLVGNSMRGKFNDEYNQAMVHHVRNELEQLRFERNKSDATGCNCRKLVVYIPPKDGSGGKKAQHRRLKPSKVIQELKKRQLYDPSVASSSRDQMEKILHNAVEKEPCCGDVDCFCVRNGIICQADACSCWHDSHVHAKHNSSSNNHALSNDDIQKRCGNPLGTYLVDTEAIDDYRIKLLTHTIQQQGQLIGSDNLICQPAKSS